MKTGVPTENLPLDNEIQSYIEHGISDNAAINAVIAGVYCCEAEPPRDEPWEPTSLEQFEVFLMLCQRKIITPSRAAMENIKANAEKFGALPKQATLVITNLTSSDAIASYRKCRISDNPVFNAVMAGVIDDCKAEPSKGSPWEPKSQEQYAFFRDLCEQKVITPSDAIVANMAKNAEKFVLLPTEAELHALDAQVASGLEALELHVRGGKTMRSSSPGRIELAALVCAMSKNVKRTDEAAAASSSEAGRSWSLGYGKKTSGAGAMR